MQGGREFQPWVLNLGSGRLAPRGLAGSSPEFDNLSRIAIIIHHDRICSLNHHSIGAMLLMDTAPTCLRCKVEMAFLRHTTDSQDSAARSLFECPTCFKIKVEPVVYEHPIFAGGRSTMS